MLMTESQMLKAIAYTLCRSAATSANNSCPYCAAGNKCQPTMAITFLNEARAVLGMLKAESAISSKALLPGLGAPLNKR